MLNSLEIQKKYPQPQNTTYLNTSSAGLVSKASIAQAAKFNEKLHLIGSKQAEEFFVHEIANVRESISRFIGADLNEIALIPNFSSGINAVIPAISKLRRVLLVKDDYPSLTLPFTLNNFDVHWLNSGDGFTINLYDIEKTIVEHRIEIIAISHIQYLTGFMIDLEQLCLLCKTHGVLLILDGTQSLGALPFDFNSSGVNIFITSNYKWMNGGYGTGIMCIDEETMQRYPPKIGGFNSYKYIEKAWKYHASINSYEPGHPNMAGLALLKEAIDYKLHIGVDKILRHNKSLVDYFTKTIAQTTYQLVGPAEHKNRSSIACIYGTKALEKYLLDHGVVVKMRNGMIRLGMHFYNTKKDIDRFVKVLSSY